MLNILQILTVVFGAATVMISVFLGWKFFKLGQHLGTALALVLIGEAVVGTITVFFAITSVFTVYNSLGPYETMFLRWSMFLVSAGTSAHLYWVMRRL